MPDRHPQDQDQALRNQKILVFSMYYSPEHSGSAPYTSDTAEYLLSLGADVHVVTTWPHYPMWRRPTGVRNRWQTTRHNGVTVHRVPCYVPRNPDLFHRAAYEASFFVASVPIAAAIRPDVVVGCMPGLSSGALAATVARCRGVRLVQLVQDLVTSGAVQSGIRGGASLRGLLSLIEGYSLRSADRISVPTDAFSPALLRLGVHREAIEVVPNWSRLTPITIDREKFREHLGWSDRTVILHTGNMGMKQGLEYLAPAIRVMESHDPNLLFVFMGDGSQRATLVAALSSASNAQVLEPVSDDEYQSTLMAADVLLVHERSSVMDMSLPSKLTSYYVAGRPILAITREGSATYRELKRSNSGLSLSSSELSRLPEVIGELLALDGHGQLDGNPNRQGVSKARSLAKLRSLMVGESTQLDAPRV